MDRTSKLKLYVDKTERIIIDTKQQQRHKFVVNTSSNYARFLNVLKHLIIYMVDKVEEDNHGLIISRQTLLMVCLCVSLYPDFPPCKTYQCRYNGTCIARGSNPMCLCPKNFHGERCESKYKLLLVALFTSFPYICKPSISK